MNDKKISYYHYSCSTLVIVIALLIISSGCSSQGATDRINNFEEELIGGYIRGCANFLLVANNEKWNNFLVINGITEEHLPDTNKVTYSITETTDLEVFIDEYPLIEDGTEFAGCFYCNDVLCSKEPALDSVNKWIPKSGIIEIKRSEIDSTNFFPAYTIELTLKDAEFLFEDRVRVIEEFIFEKINVGWLPG